MGEVRNEYMVSIGKPEEKRPLERSRRRSEHNIKIDSGLFAFWTFPSSFILKNTKECKV
jgi:hypothetical protein